MIEPTIGKWLMEVQGEDEEDMVRILQVNKGRAELRYIAMTPEGGQELITALEWMDSFRSGMVGLPVPLKPKVKPPVHAKGKS